MPKRRILLSSIALAGVTALALGLAWFQPWKLWVDHRVDEPLPAVALEPTAVADITTPQAPTSGRAPKTDPVPSGASATGAASTRAVSVPSAAVLSRGDLITHEHDTSGRVAVVRKADGSRVLTIADLDTSDGPDVQVWLTDAPVLGGERGWYVFDDGRHVSLGALKGNLGNQVYKIPDGLDLSAYTSVSLWCARFDVSFGAAELRAA